MVEGNKGKAIDVKTKKIVSMKVTKEDIHDSRMLKPLVKEAVTSSTIDRVIADGAYDSRRNFRFLDKVDFW